jgi:hypothetical protein
VSARTKSNRPEYVAGRDLKVGQKYRVIANGKGEVLDSSTYLLATNMVDKKGNRQMVNVTTGEVFLATPGSIWT